MNFKILIFFLTLNFLLSCGVKSKPVAPAGTQIPSYVDSFYQKEMAAHKILNKKKKKARPNPKENK